MKFLNIFLLSITLISITACLPEKQKTAEELANMPVIEIKDAYAFATMPGAPTAAAFMVINNISDYDDTLTSAESNVAEITEIHENMIDPDDGKMMMRKIKTLPLPASDDVTLEPKGYHIMFIKLKDPLTMGANFPLTLNFEKSKSQIIDVQIIAPGKEYKSDGHKHHHGHKH